MANKPSPIHRMPISEDLIAALIDHLDTASTFFPRPTNIHEFYKKLRVYNFKIEEGVKKPDYIATGLKRESSVNLNALGATPEESLLSQLTSSELDDVKMEAFDYEMTVGTKLPLYRFIGKTWKQVRDEEVGLTDVKVISDVEIKEIDSLDSNDSDLAAQLFGKL